MTDEPTDLWKLARTFADLGALGEPGDGEGEAWALHHLRDDPEQRRDLSGDGLPVQRRLAAPLDDERSTKRRRPRLRNPGERSPRHTGGTGPTRTAHAVGATAASAWPTDPRA